MDANETNVLDAVGKHAFEFSLVEREINVTFTKRQGQQAGTCGAADICLFIHQQVQYGTSGCQPCLDAQLQRQGLGAAGL